MHIRCANNAAELLASVCLETFLPGMSPIFNDARHVRRVAARSNTMTCEAEEQQSNFPCYGIAQKSCVDHFKYAMRRRQTGSLRPEVDDEAVAVLCFATLPQHHRSSAMKHTSLPHYIVDPGIRLRSISIPSQEVGRPVHHQSIIPRLDTFHTAARANIFLNTILSRCLATRGNPGAHALSAPLSSRFEPLREAATGLKGFRTCEHI